jgi:outer membrane lipoprotein-sorting protein
MSKRSIIIAAAVAIVLAVGGTAAFTYFSKPADHHLYAIDPQTKQRVSNDPLLFLYAVDSSTGEIKTYSPVVGAIKKSAAITQTTGSVDAQSTKLGYAASVTVLRLNPATAAQGNLPSLTWVDAQGMLQRQFFVQGVDVVYVSDQPLKEADNALAAVVR